MARIQRTTAPGGTPDRGGPEAGARQPVLFVVHPGSACGSADWSLGATDAAACRDRLAADIASWRGGIAVIDGNLSYELDLRRYRQLGEAISAALARAAARGSLSVRIVGDDGSAGRRQDWAAGEVIRRHSLSPASHRAEVTGCWRGAGGNSGCVTHVARVLRQAGFRVRVRGSAVTEPSEDMPDSPQPVRTR